MDVRAIKHAAKLSEWSERIRLCRSSGVPVKSWCEENGISVKSYYRWERLYIAEAGMQMQFPASQEAECKWPHSAASRVVIPGQAGP